LLCLFRKEGADAKTVCVRQISCAEIVGQNVSSAIRIDREVLSLKNNMI